MKIDKDMYKRHCVLLAVEGPDGMEADVLKLAQSKGINLKNVFVDTHLQCSHKSMYYVRALNKTLWVLEAANMNEVEGVRI